MLQRTSKLVAQCHERASEYARLAKSAQSEEDREFCLSMERHWLFLARSYEFTDRLGAITTELDRRRYQELIRLARIYANNAHITRDGKSARELWRRALEYQHKAATLAGESSRTSGRRLGSRMTLKGRLFRQPN